MIYKHNELKVSEEFKRLVQPISDDEFHCLEMEIKQKRIVKVYVYNGIIVDGYEEYEIAVKLGVSIEFISIPAGDRNEVVVWLCCTQLNRDDLTLMMRKYLIGRRSLAEQAVQNDKPNRIAGKTSYEISKLSIRMRIGDEYYYSERAVYAYEACSRTIDMIFTIDRELAVQLLREEKRILQKSLISFAVLSKKQLKYKLNELFGKRFSSETTPTIKTMPKYDPDAEISSLSLTVPSWINMIERVGKKVTPQITERAADEIYEKLSALKIAAENLIEQVMEVL